MIKYRKYKGEGSYCFCWCRKNFKTYIDYYCWCHCCVLHIQSQLHFFLVLYILPMCNGHFFYVYCILYNRKWSLLLHIANQIENSCVVETLLHVTGVVVVFLEFCICLFSPQDSRSDLFSFSLTPLQVPFYKWCVLLYLVVLLPVYYT
jgi:hypothetical protein